MWLVFRVVIEYSTCDRSVIWNLETYHETPQLQPYTGDFTDVAAYALAALGAASPFLPELLDVLRDKRSSRRIFAAICMALAIFATSSSRAQRVWDLDAASHESTAKIWSWVP